MRNHLSLGHLYETTISKIDNIKIPIESYLNLGKYTEFQQTTRYANLLLFLVFYLDFNHASDLVKNEHMLGIDDLKSDILSVLPGCSIESNEDSIYFSSENSLKIIFNSQVVGECKFVSNACSSDFS